MVGVTPGNTIIVTGTSTPVSTAAASPTSIGPIPASVFYSYVDSKDNILANIIDSVKNSVVDVKNTANPFTLDTVNSLQITKKVDGTLRYTDIRPMSEQLISGPLANAFGGVLGKADNLAGLGSAAAARTNLGLGDISTSSTSSVITAAQSVTALGTGAIPRALNTRVSDFGINIRDYGAAGDNVNDDGPAIRLAISVAALFGAATVWVPAGIYAFSGALVVPAGKTICFAGHGSGTSVLRQTNPTSDGIVFDNTSNNAYLTQGQHVRNLTVEAGAGLVASSFFGQGSTGRGIVYIHGNDNSGVRDVSINGFATGLALLGCFNTTHTNLRVMFGSADAILIDKAPDGVGGAGNRVQQAKLSNFGFTGANTASHGIRIRSSGGEYISKTDATFYYNGMLVDPRAGDQVAYLFFDTVLNDTSLGAGAIFDGSAGSIISVAGSMFWVSYGSDVGLLTKGPNLHGLRFANARLRENVKAGWDNQGGDGIELTAPEIHSNGRTTAAGTWPGVQIADGVTGFKSFAIIGGSIGNAESSSITQGEAIKFLGAAAQFRIECVDMTVPAGGKPPVSFQDETRLSAFKMSGNLPGASYGVNSSDRFAQPFGGYVAAGTTAYFEPAGPVPSANTAPFWSPKPLVAARVYVAVNGPPGAGQTYTYRLVVNGTPVGATGVISGASSYSATFFTGVTLNSNDTYEIQLVGSSGAGAAVHRGFITLEP